MKKIIYLLVLLFALPSIAQESKNTIEVIGEAEKVISDDSYTILIALQQVMVYEGQVETEATSLAVVEKNYIKKLEEAGVDFNRFKRNTYYEFAMSYSQSRESAYYYLKTSDKDEVRKIMQLKSSGMSIANIDIETTKLTDQELVDLSIKAIANAKEKAEAIAKKMNKTIGEIVKISDQNSSFQYIQSYGTSTKQTHGVTVSFELK
ncbi:SIMPL domain-containing protein [Formosa sp. L2A11]|uniref:SIMPL domain-containing protein n=1 Tax=Formosa sp. L2A11 TaxID=2686363 RepID=UPI00131BF35F|nr:SIMPL domain-containing protein [Formosa sp. L2A11]